jgi:hypothetical protein
MVKNLPVENIKQYCAKEIRSLHISYIMEKTMVSTNLQKSAK